MATSPGDKVTPEEFKLMSDRAGLGMSQEELDQLKPLYDMYSHSSSNCTPSICRPKRSA